MPLEEKILGILKPLGGGDPIPLKKTEMTIGRRPGNDIRLEFENISGRHCLLRYASGVWHAKDLGSTNGTSINGIKCISEHSVMPDDIVKVATHGFTIDYEPSAPDSVLATSRLMAGDDEGEGVKRRSLLELAGISNTGGDTSRPSRSSSASRGKSSDVPTLPDRVHHDDDDDDDHRHRHFHLDDDEEFELTPAKSAGGEHVIPFARNEDDQDDSNKSSKSKSKDKAKSKDHHEQPHSGSSPTPASGASNMSDDDFLQFFDND